MTRPRESVTNVWAPLAVARSCCRLVRSRRRSCRPTESPVECVYDLRSPRPQSQSFPGFVHHGADRILVCDRSRADVPFGRLGESVRCRVNAPLRDEGKRDDAEEKEKR